MTRPVAVDVYVNVSKIFLPPEVQPPMSRPAIPISKRSVVRADVWARRGDRETRVAAVQQTLMAMHGMADERI